MGVNQKTHHILYYTKIVLHQSVQNINTDQHMSCSTSTTVHRSWKCGRMRTDKRGLFHNLCYNSSKWRARSGWFLVFCCQLHEKAKVTFWFWYLDEWLLIFNFLFPQTCQCQAFAGHTMLDGIGFHHYCMVDPFLCFPVGDNMSSSICVTFPAWHP